MIAAIGWILMLLLVIALSKKAITPIAENIVRQKQFVTNAGHELKTPLAIIMANTDAETECPDAESFDAVQDGRAGSEAAHGGF